MLMKSDSLSCTEGGIVATAFLYEDAVDQNQHARAIQMLAKDLEMSEDEIARLYETTLRSLKHEARIKDYLVILVSRNVKDMIRAGIGSHTA